MTDSAKNNSLGPMYYAVQAEALEDGKLHEEGFPTPERDAFALRRYEAPIGEIETAVAGIWADVLQVERVGRHDNFFELGGRSLLAVAVLERMRRRGLYADVRALFKTPTLADLAASVGFQSAIEVPPNRIPSECEAITPEMLTLVELSAEEIGRVVAAVPGGAANVQDIYPLAPLQEGILFHHLTGGKGDPYLLAGLLSFDSRTRLQKYLEAMQAVITRHDILRTAVMWEGLREPVQVVWREAALPVEEVELDEGAGNAADQLYERYNPRRHRIDVRQAPMLRVYIAKDGGRERWLLLLLLHHLAGDHTTLDVMQEEMQAYLRGEQKHLAGALPFRNLVAEARLGMRREQHEKFFREMLGDVEDSTAPFGLVDVQEDGSGLGEWRVELDSQLAQRIRERARKLGVSAASVCHVAWGLVVGKVSGRDDVVFGTVLFGRMQGGVGADRVMGLFINTLPVRMQIGEESVESSVRRMQAMLAELMSHEHASLALAQGCSGVPAPAPLFSALLNYSHTTQAPQVLPEKGLLELKAWEGMEWLRSEERSNYPFTLTVDDLGERFAVSAQTVAPIDPRCICDYMCTVLTSLVGALEEEPGRAVWSVEVLPEAERQRVLYGWNHADRYLPCDKCVHELFEEDVERRPDVVAVVDEDATLSYGELNRRANRLAHYLRGLGVEPEVRVGICSEPGLEMIAALLAVLKAGGAYLPLDPSYPSERLAYMLEDSGAAVLLTQAHLRERLGQLPATPVLDLSDSSAWDSKPDGNLEDAVTGLISEHLALVTYTSVSAGRPKGVMITHQSVVGFVRDTDYAQLVFRDLIAQASNASLDAATFEILRQLAGGRSVYVGKKELLMPAGMAQVQMETYPSWHEVRRAQSGGNSAIVRPIANTQMYVLDGRGEPVGQGVKGALYIAGAGVSRGYLNDAAMTAERFVPDPYTDEVGACLYRTGDMAKWREDGEIEFLGRNDNQVKVGGYRIDPGEIEERLKELERIAEAVVVTQEKKGGDKQLVAYYTTVQVEVASSSGQEEGKVADDELRKCLRQSLPEYMVPGTYVRLERMPRRADGKVDRKGLAAPERDALTVLGNETPEGRIETALAQIWAEVLKVGRVGRRDNFFALGGRSLLAVQVAARARQVLDVELTIRDIFEFSTLSSLAEQIVNLKLNAFDSEDLVELLQEMKP